MNCHKKYTLLLLILIALFPLTGTAQELKEGIFTSFDKTGIHYSEQGKGYPVLLIHGFTGKGNDWKSLGLYDQLVNQGFRVITVDLRGNGQSDKPHDTAAYTNDAEAKDLMGLLKFLGVKKYAAVGYSRGSIILARLLVLDKRLRAAVMGGMGADFTNPLWPRRLAFYQGLLSDTTPGFENFYARIRENNMDRLALAYQQYGQPSTSHEALGKIKIPVLVICGVEDFDNGNGRELTALIPTAKFAEVPGTHGSAWRTPEFSATTLAFLQQQRDSRH